MSSTNNTKNLFLALLLCLGLNSLRGQSNESSLARNSLSNHTLLPADERTSAPSPSTILMIAGKQYCVTTREVTAKEYCNFLNATAVDDIHQLYNERMGSDPTMACIIRLGSPGDYYYSVIRGAEDFMVTCVDPWSGARFCNWITNGQQSSDQDPAITEHGIYDFGQTIDDLPAVNLLQNKNSNYFLSGDIEASGIYETPLSFYHSDPFLRSNISALSIDILAPWSGVSQELAPFQPSESYLEKGKLFAGDLTEVLLMAAIAAFFAGGSILMFGAVGTKVTTRFGTRLYPVAAFVGTALASRSASDKVITKLTTKNGVQPLKYEVLSFLGSIAIGMLVGWVMLKGGFVAKPLVLAEASDSFVHVDDVRKSSLPQVSASERKESAPIRQTKAINQITIKLQKDDISDSEETELDTPTKRDRIPTEGESPKEKDLLLREAALQERERALQERERVVEELGLPLKEKIAASTSNAASNARYVFGLFREAMPNEIKEFSTEELTMMMLAASLWGSGVGSHLSTHLDPYIAKLIGNTGG